MSDKITTFEQFKILGNRVKTVIDNKIANLAGLMASGLTDLQDIVMSGGVPYGKELTESWPSLQVRIKAGNFSGIRIGDFKTIVLTTGEMVVMEVAGIDQYYRCCDHEIGHHVDFISRDCLSNDPVGKFKYNDIGTNNGTASESNPWRASKLFKTINDETAGVFSTLPDDLKPVIIEKRALLESRFSSAGALNDSTKWEWKSAGKLWLPTEIEVFGSALWSDWDYGVGGSRQYPIFIGGSLHLIKGNGNGGARYSWWEASALRDSSANVCFVAGSDHAYGASAMTDWVSVPLCFRIG